MENFRRKKRLCSEMEEEEELSLTEYLARKMKEGEAHRKGCVQQFNIIGKFYSDNNNSLAFNLVCIQLLWNKQRKFPYFQYVTSYHNMQGQ